jgi:hypothetical protein
MLVIRRHAMKTTSQPNQPYDSTAYHSAAPAHTRRPSESANSIWRRSVSGFSFNRRTLAARLDEMGASNQWHLPEHLQLQIEQAHALLRQHLVSRHRQFHLIQTHCPDLMIELALFEAKGEIGTTEPTTTQQARNLHRRLREVRNSSYLNPHDDPVLGHKPNPGLDSFIPPYDVSPPYFRVV